ncbi:type II toxin-antitoxin system TacA family antitoxin [Raoultella planticola]|uniref:type II toxin-antitoxin system TacA family antitoxin n=1 Tax=Raoultella planticola TaxID=575 RepID=UPI00051632F5|nr:DUF1778 domain-containing protein [Raoultella planticola]EHR6806361.1 DUF1778 domain-containing protein [Salmonella enterica]
MKPEVREAPINIRAKTSQRDLIDMAASLVSKSRTDFMLEVACREAQDILLDQRLFLLNGNQFEAFIEELDAPITPERQARIDNLMNRKLPWE